MYKNEVEKGRGGHGRCCKGEGGEGDPFMAEANGLWGICGIVWWKLLSLLPLSSTIPHCSVCFPVNCFSWANPKEKMVCVSKETQAEESIGAKNVPENI